MSVETELTKLQSNLANSYTSCESKGATMPSSQNFDNLATTIDSIETGGGGITPTGTISITENGTYDVTNYASADVNVAESSEGSSEPPEFPSYMDSIILTSNEWGTDLPVGAFKGTFKNAKARRFGIFEMLGSYSPGEWPSATDDTFEAFDNGSFYANDATFQEAFKGNKTVKVVAFGAIFKMSGTTALLDCFVNSAVEKIYININVNKSALVGYDNKWGAPNATIITFGFED